MKLSLEQLSARMRQGETIPSRQTAQVALALSIPSILEQLVVTAMGYIDAAMVGHIGAEATASIGIVSSSTWLLHGMLAGQVALCIREVMGEISTDSPRGQYIGIEIQIGCMQRRRRQKSDRHCCSTHRVLQSARYH